MKMLQSTTGVARRWLARLVRRFDLWLMWFDTIKWRGRIMAANYNSPKWPEPWAYLRFRFWHMTGHLRPAIEWLNMRVMALADRLERDSANDEMTSPHKSKGNDYE